MVCRNNLQAGALIGEGWAEEAADEIHDGLRDVALQLHGSMSQIQGCIADLLAQG